MDERVMRLMWEGKVMLRSGCRKNLRYKIKCLNNPVAIQAWILPRFKKLSRAHWYAKAVRLAKNNRR